MDKQKVVVMGGGSGTSMLLNALKSYPLELSAIISMTDDGSSTGLLRQAYGVLPPGDVRQCLLALCQAPSEVQAMFGYRFADGPLQSHTVGNIILTALQKTTGSFDKAVEVASNLLQTQGEVIPATLENIRQGVKYLDGRVVMGEHQIDVADLGSADLQIIFEPTNPHSNPKAIEAIKGADVIIIGPGSYYTSLLPVLLPEVCEAIKESKAKLIFNANLVTLPTQNAGWSVVTFMRRLETFIGRTFDHITYNTAEIPVDALASVVGTQPAVLGDPTPEEQSRLHGASLAYHSPQSKVAGDPIARTPIRHDTAALGKLLMEIINTL